MNDKEMPEGLCWLGQIFWRVEEQGPGPSDDIERDSVQSLFR